MKYLCLTAVLKFYLKPLKVCLFFNLSFCVFCFVINETANVMKAACIHLQTCNVCGHYCVNKIYSLNKIYFLNRYFFF